MKTLHVIVGLDAGGAEHVLRRLIESHRGRLEFQHSVVSLTNVGELDSALVAGGIDVQALCAGLAQVIQLPRTTRDVMGQRGHDRINAKFPLPRPGKDPKEYTCHSKGIYMSLVDCLIARPTLT